MLVAEWEDKYSGMFYKELLACARNKEAAKTIADWQL
jgi:hypothetical protein